MSFLGTLYIAALIVGAGVNVLQFVMAGLAGDADADGGAGGADAHADADALHADADVPHADADAGSELHGHADTDVVSPAGDAAHPIMAGGFLPLVLSFRFWTFGLMAFGLFGVPVHFLGVASESVTLVIALVLGAVSGLVASVLFRVLRSASSQSGMGASDVVGQVGRVLIPVTRGARGKVRVHLRGQTTDYLARSDDEDLEVGAEVIVSEVGPDEIRVCRAPSELRTP